MPITLVKGIDRDSIEAAVTQALPNIVFKMAQAQRDLIHTEMYPGHALRTGALKAGLRVEHGESDDLAQVVSDEHYWPWPLEWGVPSVPAWPKARHIISKAAKEVLAVAAEIAGSDLRIVALRIGG